MSTWRPDQYLQFEEERTRPCRDLAAQIHVDEVRTIIDLGCGPGNSTAVLAKRWPAAKITGLDSSLDMLNRAREDYPHHEWIHGDIADWALNSRDEYDIVFANAALQWLDDHRAIFPQLLQRVATGGVLAVQMPANNDAPAYRTIANLAASDAWRARFPPAGIRQPFANYPPFYYDLFVPIAAGVNIWETIYTHVLPDAKGIAEWYRATGLRPFLDHLGSDTDREHFLRDYTEALRSDYAPRQNGRVLFPFRRLFLIISR